MWRMRLLTGLLCCAAVIAFDGDGSSDDRAVFAISAVSPDQ
jgi:hypothetical protein